MAVTSLQLTYDEIRANLGMYLSVNRTAASWSPTTTTDVSYIMRKGLRKAYYPQPLGPGQAAHQWSFLRPWFTTTTAAPTSTSTITVVNGLVTAAASAFTTSAANAWMVIGGIYYEVASYSTPTVIQLVDTTIDYAAGTEYELRYYRYALPTDFVSIEGRLTYAADESTIYRALEQRSDEFIRRLYQDSDTDDWSDEPMYYTIYPSAVATTAIQSWYMMLWPSPDQIFHIRGRYNVQMADLDGTNQYPPGGAQHSEMILEAVLSEAELTYNDTPGPHTARFLELLAASISLDRQTSTPDTMGKVPMLSERSQGQSLWQNNTNDYVIPDGMSVDDFTV